MVATAIPAPRSRPVRDPVRPVGRGVTAALLAVGVGLSLLGWATAARLTAVQESAERASTSAAVSERHEVLADGELERAQDQRDGLRALVVFRCDTGQITDDNLCDAARRITPAR